MAINKFFHTVTSSFVLAALFVVGVSAWYLLRRREQLMARRSIAIASAFGFVFALVTAFTGDRSGAIVARVQPMKLAAMEALYDGQQGAPLTAVGIAASRRRSAPATTTPSTSRSTSRRLLSLMSFRSADAFVPGINDLVYGNEEYGVMPACGEDRTGARGRRASWAATARRARRATQAAIDRDRRPSSTASTPQGAEFLREYFAYFGYGYLYVAGADRARRAAAVLLVPRDGRRGLLLHPAAGPRLVAQPHATASPTNAGCCGSAVWSVPLAYLASQAGWVVAEVGRQPWAIQDLMPVGVAASKIPSGSVSATFFLFLALFTALLAAESSIMFRQIKTGPKDD